MAAFQPARGTHDIIGEDMRRHRQVVETARRIAGTYGFDEWQTPIFEPTGLFARSLGDTSDIVTKEMYSFDDRGGDGLTLRPEGTAGICRALVTNGLTQSLPQRVFYAGPMFRYERPQKGRTRQFHQIGAELIGPAEPLADAETIALARDILAGLGLDRRVRLELNTLGDAESRAAWREALIAHFTRFRDDLSAESRTRLERNPLRILDSKDERDRALIADAPMIGASLNDASRAFRDEVRAHLALFEVPFVDNPRIVRGLDYYSHTAFEFTTDELGAQSAVLAGGRYDGLVAEIGGPPTPAIGWAAGIERLSLLLAETPPARRPIAVIPLDDDAHSDALRILAMLRHAGLRAEMAYRGNARRRLERANRAGAVAAILLGEDERTRSRVTLKLLDSGAQHTLMATDLPRFLLDHLPHDGT